MGSPGDLAALVDCMCLHGMVSALHLNLRACAATQRLSSYPCPTQAFLGSKLFFFVDQNYHSLIGWTLGMVWDHTTTLASFYTYHHFGGQPAKHE